MRMRSLPVAWGLWLLGLICAAHAGSPLQNWKPGFSNPSPIFLTMFRPIPLEKALYRAKVVELRLPDGRVAMDDYHSRGGAIELLSFRKEGDPSDLVATLKSKQLLGDMSRHLGLPSVLPGEIQWKQIAGRVYGILDTTEVHPIDQGGKKLDSLYILSGITAHPQDGRLIFIGTEKHSPAAAFLYEVDSETMVVLRKAQLEFGTYARAGVEMGSYVIRIGKDRVGIVLSGRLGTRVTVVNIATAEVEKVLRFQRGTVVSNLEGKWMAVGREIQALDKLISDF